MFRADYPDSSVDGILEVRVLHDFAVADLHEIPLEGSRRVHAVPGRWVESEGDRGVVLLICA